MKQLTSQDEGIILNILSDKVNAILADSSSGTDFKDKVEADTAKTLLGVSDDGVDVTDDSDEYDTDYASIDDFKSDALNSIQDDIDQNKGYFDTNNSKKPATDDDIDNAIPDINLNDNQFKSSDDLIRREPKVFHFHRKQAIQSPKTEWASDNIAYRKNAYECDGETKQFTQAAQRVNWGDVLSKEAKSQEDAIERLRSFVTFSIKQYYGGWNRIQTIVVRSQQLIINDACYMPVIEKEHINPKIFPLDTLDYIRNGCIAQFFNWQCLKQMHNLYLIDIDDANFFVTNVGADLGIGRRIGVSSLFKFVRSLDILIIGGEKVTLEDLNKPESVPIKEKVAKSKRTITFSDNYRLNIIGGLNGIQNYTFTNLKNYATNRGNKNILRFCCGTIGRAGLAGVAGILNLGAHAISAAGQVLKQGFTPISESEMYNN